MALQKRWKILIIAILILGFAMLTIPSPLSEPNYLGIPLAPILMFVFAVTLYTLVTKHCKTLYVTVAILVALFTYTGFWFYNYKMPLTNLTVTLIPKKHGINPTSQYFGGNQCDLSFDIMIQNPTDIDTPPFLIENVDFYINNLKLSGYSTWWHRSGGLGPQGVWYHDTHSIIEAHQTLNISREGMGWFGISIYSNRTDARVWENLVVKNFTLSISGSFTSRPNFKKGDYSTKSLRILAAAKFIASCKFDEV